MRLGIKRNKKVKKKKKRTIIPRRDDDNNENVEDREWTWTGEEENFRGANYLFSRGKVLRSIPEYYRSLFRALRLTRPVWTNSSSGVCPSLPLETLAATSSSSSPPLPVVVKLAGQTDIRRGACTVSPRRGWQGGRRGKPWGLAEDEAAVCRQNSTSCATLTKARALWINYCNYIISLFRYPPSPPRYRNDTDSNWPETWSSRDGGK